MNTLSEENQASIKCPALGVEARLADCLTLRDRVWRGERIEERRGCQACMASSKCAAAQIVHDMWVHKEDPGYYSATPKVVTLSQGLQDTLARVLIQEKTLDRLGVVDEERMVLLAANERAGKAVKASIDTSDWAQPKAKRAPAKGKAERAPEKAPESKTVAAALSGDMSAALSQVVAAKPKPDPAPAPKIEPKPQPKAPAPEPVSTKGLSLLERAKLAKQGRAA